jgi:hypothetical protein
MCRAQNLATWTQFQGFDPEISTGSLTGAQYPALRTITFGSAWDCREGDKRR